MWTQCTSVTDRRTDRRKDRITITKTVQRIASHGKTFIKILYLIIGYGPLRVMREFPSKRRKTFGSDNLTTKLLKKGLPSARMGVAYRGCA